MHKIYFINLFSVLKLYSVSMKIHKSSCYYIWTITTSSPMISIFVESSFMADMSIVLPLFWTITRKNCLRFHYCHNAELVTFAYEFSFKGWSLPSIPQKLFLMEKICYHLIHSKRYTLYLYQRCIIVKDKNVCGN